MCTLLGMIDCIVIVLVNWSTCDVMPNTNSDSEVQIGPKVKFRSGIMSNYT